jgi:hypothetical protein
MEAIDVKGTGALIQRNFAATETEILAVFEVTAERI